MVVFYKKWKKYNEIQLLKNKMDLNIRKMTNHPPSPARFVCFFTLARVVLYLLSAEYSVAMCGAWPGTLVK